MKLAYFIMCHKNSRQVARLIRAIHRPENVYLIHADKKVGPVFLEELKYLCAPYGNVHFMNPMVVSWGGWSLVYVQNLAIQRLLELCPDWDYFINLSGQCYPLQSQESISSFLSEAGDTSFIYFNDLTIPYYHRFYMERQETIIAEFQGVAKDTGIPRPYFHEVFGDTVQLGMGSQWVMLERQFCEYLCEDNPLLEQFKGYFRQFNIPDEHYVQTVALNSPFIDRIDSDIRRCIYIPTDESHPKIMTVEDYPQLMSSGCFFARKFDDEVDAAILDALDVHIFAKVPVDNVNNSVDNSVNNM